MLTYLILNKMLSYGQGIILKLLNLFVQSWFFLKNANIGGFSYMAGFNFDIKFGKDISFNEFNSGVGFGFIRIRYSYCMPRLAEKYDGMTGNMHCFTVGIGAFGRTVKRDK